MKEEKGKTKENVVPNKEEKNKSVEQVKKELEEELGFKKIDLLDKEVAIKGGTHPTTKKERVPIDKEIHRVKRAKRKFELMHQYDAPLTAVFQFETIQEYRDLKKEEIQEQIDGAQKIINILEKQKEEIVKQIPELQKRINEIEKELGKKLTEFKVDNG